MRVLLYQGTKLVLDYNYPQPTSVVGEALIRVLQVGICNTDLEIVRGYMGFRGVLGHEFVGVVEEVYGESERRGGGFCGAARCEFSDA
ncbi:MAG: alcohol dehydrogenase catalytic domain-containing protein [Ktedonobacteraceae bacterium]|nr:alcohol dehydrogenase catalytic domain-containing protein [Ktedonobacteraceae bacterium]